MKQSVFKCSFINFKGKKIWVNFPITNPFPMWHYNSYVKYSGMSVNQKLMVLENQWAPVPKSSIKQAYKNTEIFPLANQDFHSL